MSVYLALRCSGPEGEHSGCPHGLEVSTAGRAVPDSHDALKNAYASLLKEVEARGWRRSTRDLMIRCPSCAEAAEHPAAIAGIAWERWNEALRRYEAGELPSAWGGRDGLPTARQFNNAIRKHPTMLARVQAAPIYRAKQDRAAPLPSPRWDEVLARFEAGGSKDAICAGRDGWPTKKQWNGQMERDAEFRRRVNAEHERRGPTDAMFDRAIEHVKAGGAVAALPGLPDTCSHVQFWRRLAIDEGFAARYRIAREIAGQTHIWVASVDGKRIRFDGLVDWQGAVDALRKGAFVRDVIGAVRIGRYPYARQWYYRLKTDPDFAAEVKQAYEDGWWLRPRLKYDRVIPPASYDKCLELIVSGLRPKEAAKLAGIPIAAYRRRCRSDRAYGRRAKDALEFHRRQGLRQKAEARARKDAVNALPVGAVLQQRLSQNQIYATVNAAVSHGFPRDVRDDLISAIVLDVLEGTLQLADVRAKVRSYVTRHHRETGRYTDMSLSTPVGDGDASMIDLIGEDQRLWT